MDDRNTTKLNAKVKNAKRLSLLAMIAFASTSTRIAPTHAEDSRLSALLHAVPTSEFIALRAPVASIEVSEATTNQPEYAKRTWDEAVNQSSADSGQSTARLSERSGTLKHFIAPESIADLVRSGSPEDLLLPSQGDQSGLSMPEDIRPNFDATQDFSETINRSHVGNPVPRDAVNISPRIFSPGDATSITKSQISDYPADSTDFGFDVQATDADERARRVAETQGFELFCLQNLDPPAESQSTSEPDSSAMNATIHAKRLSQLAKISLQDSHSRMQRRATHSAQKYALEALRLSIDVEDAIDGGNQHMQDLQIAQNAIRESKDFDDITSKVDWRTMRRMVAAHETDVLKNRDLGSVSAIEATGTYLELAREKLIQAGENSTLAAEALVMLGMIEKQLPSRADVHTDAVALTYQGAATIISPGNATAHREFGRTLLQQGMVQQSILSLKQSIALNPTRKAYQSLLDAARRGGDHELAQKCLVAMQNPNLINDTAVKRLPPSQFAASYRPSPQVIQNAPSPKAANVAAETQPEKARFSFRNIFGFGRR